ncbi:hypothetical protein ATANTOWER_027249 [Ataeniobius toweri]|uniref:Secreted protein n=1 Tax=Ataeniobius toweri TaxID=208326 RepID=A0ABU7C6W9_9TELE|nr:hypothetical protein [Ataeniobius toweri]
MIRVMASILSGLKDLELITKAVCRLVCACSAVFSHTLYLQGFFSNVGFSHDPGAPCLLRWISLKAPQRKTPACQSPFCSWNQPHGN